MLQSCQFGFDVRESSFEGFAADGAGGALVEDSFALEFEGVACESAGGLSGVGGILCEFGVG